jgi:hypothetical protein
MKAKFTTLRLACLWVVFSLVPTHASDEIPAFWPIEQRCIPDPVGAPHGWSYPGTILMSGSSGIHAIQADWETSRVVAFFRQNENGDKPIDGGQLSPDTLWYAAPMGETFTEASFNTYWSVKSLRLYSTSGDGENIDFNLSDYQDIYTYFEAAWSYLPVEWRDNNSLFIGKLLIQPFQNKVEEAAFNLVGITLEDRFVSPDVTLAYRSNVLYNLTNPEPSIAIIGGVDSVSWRRNSAGFIASIRASNDNRNLLALYNREGEQEELIFNLDKGEVNFQTAGGRSETLWSPEGNQVAFTENLYPEPNRLFLVDLQAQIVIDTCLNAVDNPIWSPDGTRLAYRALGRDYFKIIIVDLQDWKAYDIARHNGSLMGWRSVD